jgi:flagellar motor switch protein FliM
VENENLIFELSEEKIRVKELNHQNEGDAIKLDQEANISYETKVRIQQDE